MTGTKLRQTHSRMMGFAAEAKARNGLTDEQFALRLGLTGRTLRNRREEQNMYKLSLKQALDILELAGYEVEVKWRG